MVGRLDGTMVVSMAERWDDELDALMVAWTVEQLEILLVERTADWKDGSMVGQKAVSRDAT